MVRSVFLLWHTHALPDGGEDAKLLGVYSSRQLAEKKIEEKYRDLALLEENDDFVIDEYEVDRDEQDDKEEGFGSASSGVYGNA